MPTWLVVEIRDRYTLLRRSSSFDIRVCMGVWYGFMELLFWKEDRLTEERPTSAASDGRPKRGWLGRDTPPMAKECLDPDMERPCCPPPAIELERFIAEGG